MPRWNSTHFQEGHQCYHLDNHSVSLNDCKNNSMQMLFKCNFFFRTIFSFTRIHNLFKIRDEMNIILTECMNIYNTQEHNREEKTQRQPVERAK